jgi:hypothetical protein
VKHHQVSEQVWELPVADHTALKTESSHGVKVVIHVESVKERQQVVDYYKVQFDKL